MRSAVLMSHAPIVIPAVGGRRAPDCSRTTEAMRRSAASLVGSEPEVVVVLSPHTPRHRTHWGLVRGPRLEGSLRSIGHPGLCVDLPNAHAEVAAALPDIPLADVAPQPLDNGALVPLWFLVEAGWSGPTAVLGVPWHSHDGIRIGEALARRPDWAVVASGDLSHRLRPGAPAGYDPFAHRFDETFVSTLREGDLLGAASPRRLLRELAAEDVVDTTEVLVGALGPTVDHDPVLHYEGPFGVGYCVAVFAPSP